MKKLQKKIIPLIGLVFFCFTGFTQQDISVSVSWEKEEEYFGSVISSGWDMKVLSELDRSILKIYLHQDNGKSTPAIIGKYRVVGDSLIFTPHFPFSYDLKYRVEIRDNPIYLFQRPHPSNRVSTFVKFISPTADTLPTNLLKIYLHFSAPMSEGNAYDHIHLLSETGDTMNGTFLHLLPELWNDDKTRLTLWFDPGRIKRDLGPNNVMGAPLEQDQKYQLVINSKWPDQQGFPIQKYFRKHLVIKKADRLQPNPNDWDIKLPQQYTFEPLVIDFGESLDLATAQNGFEVFDASASQLSQDQEGENHKNIKGKIEIVKNESQFYFTPSTKWHPGQYTIRIKGSLEDVAGNNLNRLFDRDLDQDTTERKEEEYYYLKFEIRAL